MFFAICIIVVKQAKRVFCVNSLDCGVYDVEFEKRKGFQSKWHIWLNNQVDYK